MSSENDNGAAGSTGPQDSLAGRQGCGEAGARCKKKRDGAADSAAETLPVGSTRNGVVVSAPPDEALFGGADATPTYGVARYLAWVFLLLIVGLAIFLSLMIGQSARETLVKKQYDFAAILGDNLNHQIYARFTVPTAVIYQYIALRHPVQYERMDNVIQQLIPGLDIKEVNIYDNNGVLSYSLTRPEDRGLDGLASPEVKRVLAGSEPIITLDGKVSMFQAFFSPNLEPGSWVLRGTYPMRFELKVEYSDDEGYIMGALEFTRDITQDMVGVLQLQRVIIAIVLVSSLLIFLIMIFFLTKAEKALAARVEEKEKLLEKLHQNEKLAGMGRVIAGIAHEIRNPLGIICSSAQFLIQRNKGVDERSAGILNAIFDESRRLSQTVTDFLDYARPREPRQDSVNVGAVLDQALVFLQPELEKNKISLIRDYDEEAVASASVSGDKDLLYRAFYNVLTNAAQALGELKEEGGRELTLHIAKSGSGKYQELSVSVADNGPGFGDGDLARFLDPFYTTKALGTGLGLPIVSSIVTMHKGRLELMNRNGAQAGELRAEHGALARIVLPLAR
ncbi:two-component sensor histidine kinase [Desulfovibrio sp. OttesenSCG-928-C14]|nr:two-component sensor histidine kinase [Desulfovibrio sp. OttesenSCG-928-C14]